jgi:hypothetical protein
MNSAHSLPAAAATAQALDPEAPSAPAPLLHNIGGPARTSIVWQGYTPPKASGDAPVVARGAWLRCRYVIRPGEPLSGVSWNTTVNLLKVLEPSHGLSESAARAYLVERLEARITQLNWPATLIAEQPRSTTPSMPNPHDVVTDAELTFVMLAKSTGTLWRRDRPVSLAFLHAPDKSSGTNAATVWQHQLWFANGRPAIAVTDSQQAAADSPVRRAT